MTTARDKWAEVRSMDAKIDLKMGPNFVDRFLGDPKRIGFLFARYAFAAKMLRDCRSILDIGCGDGAGTATFLQDTTAQNILGIDYDISLIKHATEELLPAIHEARPDDWGRIMFSNADFIGGAMLADFDAVVSLDVIEHIEPKDSTAFLRRIHNVLIPHGVAIIGTPNKMAEHLASEHSRIGHINTMAPGMLYEAMRGAGFQRCFLFGMNDGTLNVGHPDLWHYVFAVACK